MIIFLPLTAVMMVFLTLAQHHARSRLWTLLGFGCFAIALALLVPNTDFRANLMEILGTVRQSTDELSKSHH
jgi:hypothetical protein